MDRPPWLGNISDRFGIRVMLPGIVKKTMQVKPHWITLLEQLGFKARKAEILQEKLYVATAAEFFDAYAPDKENGLRQHMFIAKTREDLTEEEKKEEDKKQGDEEN